MNQMKSNILGIFILIAPWVVMAQKEATIDKSVVTVIGGAKQVVPLRLTERQFLPMQSVGLPSESFDMKFQEQGEWPLQKLPQLNPTAIDMREGDEKNSAYGVKYANALKIGGGNYGRTLLNFNVGFAPKDNSFLGVYVNHDGNLSGPVAEEFSARNENQVKVMSRHFGEKTFWDSHVNYQRTLAHYYGMTEIPQYYTPKNLELTNERFTYFGRFSNAKKEAKSDYSLSTDLTFFRNLRNETEMLSTSQLTYSKNYSSSIKGNLVADYILAEYTAPKALSRSFYRLKPSVVFKSSRVAFTAGLNIIQSKEGNEPAENSVFPIMNLDVGSTDFFHFFAGIGGDVQFNSLNSFSNENIWLAPSIELRNTDQVGHVYAGIKGSDDQNLDFEFRYSYSEYANLPFFMNTKADLSQFEMQYLGGLKKVQVTNLGGHLNFHVNTQVTSGLKFDYVEYQQLQSFDKAYHKPNLTLSWTNTWKLTDYMILSPDVYYIQGLYALNPLTGKSVALENILDVNVKLNFLLKKNLNLALQGNNLTGKSYQRYYQYAVQGLNYNATLGYSF